MDAHLVPTPVQALAAPQLADLLRQGANPPAAGTRWVTLGVLALHLAGLWALMQVPAVRQAARAAVPLVFSLVTPQPTPEPPPAAPTAPVPPRSVVPTRLVPAPPRPAPAAPPVLATAPEAPAAFTSASVPLATPLPPTTATADAPPAPVAAAAPAQTAPPLPTPAPRLLPASAVSYLVAPPVEVPLTSRRLGETGTVLLRVLVGTDGRPQRITLHKGSGHARLDEQALWAMGQARFKPQTDNGQPVAWIVIAPLAYELD
jgi:periplasmic protein TonB